MAKLQLLTAKSPKTFVIAPVRNLINDSGEDLVYDSTIRNGVMGPKRRFEMPRRKLSLKQGKLDVPFKHRINYKSAYDFDKITTTQFESTEQPIE
jgi:hypothetical protein